MFSPISIDECVKQHLQSNSGENPADFRTALIEAVELKMRGCKCYMCGQPIWAIGNAITGEKQCFTCITGESNNAEDFEIKNECF